MQKLRRLTAREERGQVLVLTALCLVVLLGAAALALDIGRMAVTRRQMQNAADSSALAGAWSLRTSNSAAIAAATSWATDADKNNLLAGELTNVEVVSTTSPNDSVRVEVRRNVPYIFARVLGLSSHDITATATAQLKVINGITAGITRAFPYAVWLNRNDTVHAMIDEHRTVVFHSNHYQQTNVDSLSDCTKNKKNPPPGCTWDVESDNFKGYFHWENGANYFTQTGYAFSQGGNAVGTSEYNEMMAYFQAGTPVLLPVIDQAKNPNGQRLDFNIVAFVCVRITQMGNPAIDWKGVVLEDGCAANGLYTGPRPPAAENAYVPILVQ
jgi:Flp pilus assembly protein TadG